MIDAPSNIARNIKIFERCIIVSLLIICGRLLYLQQFLNELFVAKSRKNYERFEYIPAPRGAMLDMHGIPLATNRPVVNLYWHGSHNNRLTRQQYELIAHIEQICNTRLRNVIDIRALSNCERHGKHLCIVSDLSVEHISQLAEKYPNHPNLNIVHTFARYYPYKELCCHTVGYVTQHGPSSTYMGLERAYHDILHGHNGTIIHTTNSLGKKLESTYLNQVTAGSDIRTTIDLPLQQIAEQLLRHDRTGTLILMEPRTGAVRALCSRPDFNPAIFLQPISSETWNNLITKKPFIHRAVNATYPPGSIFKLITVSAALENNLASPNDTWNCAGYYRFGNRTYWCHKRDGHGTLNLSQGLAYSCNSMFYELGTRLPIDLLAEYAQRFGLGAPTGIILPEKDGLVPTQEWKYTTKGERWWPGETLITAIGQSFLLVTPMQIARMIGSIFTGYLVTPRLVESEPIVTQELHILPETRAFLQKSMKQVIKRGTGKRINTIADMKIYAKTSTAQISRFTKRSLGHDYLEHGWFVTYFEYENAEPLVMVMLIEHAGSASVATHLAKQFLVEYKKLIDTRLH